MSDRPAYLLVQAAQEWLVALLDHLRGYLDKHRWEDRSLLDPQESAAWIRTVAFFAGEYREGCSTDALSAMRQTAMEEHSSRACPEKAPGKAGQAASEPDPSQSAAIVSLRCRQRISEVLRGAGRRSRYTDEE